MVMPGESWCPNWFSVEDKISTGAERGYLRAYPMAKESALTATVDGNLVCQATFECPSKSLIPID